MQRGDAEVQKKEREQGYTQKKSFIPPSPPHHVIHPPYGTERKRGWRYWRYCWRTAFDWLKVRRARYIITWPRAMHRSKVTTARDLICQNLCCSTQKPPCHGEKVLSASWHWLSYTLFSGALMTIFKTLGRVHKLRLIWQFVVTLAIGVFAENQFIDLLCHLDKKVVFPLPIAMIYFSAIR